MNSRPRLVVFVIMIVALSALSFHGALDSFAKERVKDTTIETIGIYVVARAINAGVSMLQSVDVGVEIVGSVSINPGEILDPLNDAVERLSGIAVWAIGSLFLQQIVLDVAVSPVFKWLFGAVGLLTLCALLPLGSTRFSEQACRVSGISEEMLNSSCKGVVRIFVVVAVLRFIVPVFIACSFLVSEMLVQSHLEQNKDELAVLDNEVRVNQDTAPPEDSGLTDWASKLKILKLKEMLGRLADSMNDYLISIAKMLIVLLIKNILFPLLFLYIAMKCGISIIRRATPLIRSGLDTKRELQEAGKKMLGT